MWFCAFVLCVDVGMGRCLWADDRLYMLCATMEMIQFSWPSPPIPILPLCQVAETCSFVLSVSVHFTDWFCLVVFCTDRFRVYPVAQRARSWWWVFDWFWNHSLLSEKREEDAGWKRERERERVHIRVQQSLPENAFGFFLSCLIANSHLLQ
jgi:hypothetical protein